MHGRRRRFDRKGCSPNYFVSGRKKQADVRLECVIRSTNCDE